jgi:hypothetical protein
MLYSNYWTCKIVRILGKKQSNEAGLKEMQTLCDSCKKYRIAGYQAVEKATI